MRIVYPRGCGMDVHQQSVTAGLHLIDQDGEFTSEKRRFGTMTKPLREMATWLKAQGVEHIAREATGVYGKPVWNILEGEHQFNFWPIPSTSRTYRDARPTRKTASGSAISSSMVCCRVVSFRRWRFGGCET